MDEKTKQRIVGVIVITALLTIFLPMLFEDPVERSSRSISEMQIPELPQEFQIERQVQVPESIAQVLQAPSKAQPEIKPKPAIKLKSEAGPEQVVKLKQEPKPKAVANINSKPKPAQAKKPKIKPTAKKVAIKPAQQKAKRVKAVKPEDNVKKLSRWVIQVGSFKSKENAQKERDKLRKQGFVAFVEAYKNMYRVRIGPELDKAKAMRTQKSLEAKSKVKTFLVSE